MLERILARAWEDSPVAAFVTDRAGVIQWVNAAFTTLTGYAPEDAIGRTPQILKSGQQSPEFYERMWRTILSGQPWLARVVNRHKGGDVYRTSLSITPVADDEGAVTHFVALQFDGFHAETDSGVDDSLSMLQATLEATTDGILVVDREGRMASWNRRFLEMWRLPESIVAARDDARTIQYVSAWLKDPEWFQSKIREVYRNERAESFDVVEFIDGRVLERYSRPQLLHGQAVGRVWSFRDVTEYRRSEEEIKRLNAGLERTVAERTAQLDGAVQNLTNEVAERKRVEEALRAREEQLRLKLNAILTPEYEIGEQDLADILDVPAMQSMMEDLTRMTNMATAILDLKGKVLVATGWQEVCTRFHRMNPETARNCTESDLYLAHNVRPGEHVLYKCKNQMWDVVTPLFVGDKYVGNIYGGQFFFEDEAMDLSVFAEQAARYGFDREQYLAALARVPRVSRERVNHLMGFLAAFAAYASRLGYANLKLARAISDQARVAVALRESEELFRSLATQAPIPIAICDMGGKVEYLNDQFTAVFGYTRDDLPNTAAWFERAYPDQEHRRKNLEVWQRTLERAAREKVDVERGEFQVTCKDGSVRSTYICGTQFGDRFLVLLDDITERKHAEQERARLEQQLQQSQKMEAVGRLAGGVAHDFNNLLTVINGYAELALSETDCGRAVHQHLVQIRRAGERATELTKQLLTFSRKQVIQPRVLDLSAVVRDAEKMLGRVLGEDVELICRLEEPLGKVRFDPGQAHQVLMNLVVNARDAMPEGGRLTIETCNVHLDSRDDALPAPASAGAYVMVAVSDTGVGMAEEVRSHLFEPFFTTKEHGKGTGLGLATVFGIVQQNGGHIRVHSEPGQGTIFRIFLPQAEAPAELTEQHHQEDGDWRGRETVLVVEDQRELRELAGAILSGYGYQVLEAPDGAAALEICRLHHGVIDAMVTDVVMPGMSGWDLAARLAALRPDMRVLFMSGYTENVAMRKTVFYGAVDYLQKPFTPEALARKLRECLDRPRKRS